MTANKMKVVDRSKRYRACVDLIDLGQDLFVGGGSRKRSKRFRLRSSIKLSPCRSGLAWIRVNPIKWFVEPVRLPNGSGNQVRVLVFAQGQAAEAAKEAGAEYVGFEDLIKKCQEGFQDFDVAIATPGAMAEVRKLGKILGPRGLMPNPKTGTVTEDTAKAVREVKAGRVEFKLDKNGNVAVPMGKFSFAPKRRWLKTAPP